MKTGRRRCYSLTICNTSGAEMSNNNEKLLVPSTVLNSNSKSKQKSQSDFLIDHSSNSATTSDADQEMEESSAETSIGSSGVRSSTPSDYGMYRCYFSSHHLNLFCKTIKYLQFFTKRTHPEVIFQINSFFFKLKNFCCFIV